MRLASVDAALRLGGIEVAARAVVAGVAALLLLGALALGVELLLGAEARVGGAGVDELLQRCLVRIGALGLEVLDRRYVFAPEAAMKQAMDWYKERI